MPTYEYECDKCKRLFEVMQNMSDPKFTIHKDVTEGHAGLPEPCDGVIHRHIGGGGGVIFRGSGWTPRFGGKAGSAQKKMDQALKAAGIEDCSPGWTIADDKPKETKKTKGKKYVGQLKVN